MDMKQELFELALKETGLSTDEVIHIGDSISSDVKGAGALNIKTLWLNRFGKDVPDGVESIENLLQTQVNLIVIRKLSGLLCLIIANVAESEDI